MATTLIGGEEPDNRTAVSMNGGILLLAGVGFVGSTTMRYPQPLVMWLIDGVPMEMFDIFSATGYNYLNSIVEASYDNLGVYQCIFTGRNSEIIGAIPIRIDAGE